MANKPKTFDCVAMKNRIQAERLAEYESRKGEFASYLDFINARVKDSELMNTLARTSRVSKLPQPNHNER